MTNERVSVYLDTDDGVLDVETCNDVHDEQSLSGFVTLVKDECLVQVRSERIVKIVKPSQP